MGEPLDSPLASVAMVTEQKTLTGYGFRLFSAFWTRLLSCTAVVASARLTAQHATIATTALHTVTQDGFYRFSYYLRVTTADGVSSSAQLTLTWREGSQTCTKTFTNVNGDTVTSFDADTYAVRADSGTSISYAVAYASNTAAKMQFRMEASVELIT